jgi:hypothetical protein
MPVDFFEDGGRPLDTLEISALELSLGAKLPLDYRNFLSTQNGGRPIPSMLELEGLQVRVRELFAANSGDSRDLLRRHESLRDVLPSGVLPIGLDTGDNYFCIALVPGQSGAVYWKDHESLLSESEEGLTKVADSFSQFIDLLHLKSELTVAIDPIESLGRFGTRQALRDYLVGGKSVNSVSEGGRTIAQEAARFGNVALLKACHEFGANLRGCAHLGALNGHFDIVRYLIEEANVDLEERNESGWTILSCTSLDPELANYLRGKGAKS